MRFFDEDRRSHMAKMRDNLAIYGSVDLQAFLISVGEALYATDVNLLEVLWRSFIIERVAKIQTTQPFDTVVEIGCGSGVNLFNLYLRLDLLSIAGCDLAPNAVRFLTQIAHDMEIESTFKAGDYGDLTVIDNLSPESKRWALLSVHAIEQTQGLTLEWFEGLLALPNPPVLGMHFEPLHWGDDTPFAHQCRRYAELNEYNRSFVELVQSAEAVGLVKVLHVEKRVMGTSAFNPTSVLMWQPS